MSYGSNGLSIWLVSIKVSLNYRLMATSQSVADLVLKQWSRHAKKFDFQLFAVPEDAFAEPTNYLSSPLRSPIFVDFNTEELPEDNVSTNNVILKQIVFTFLVERMH
jgi:hypothetical protein